MSMDKIQDIMARWTALQPLSDRDRDQKRWASTLQQ